MKATLSSTWILFLLLPLLILFPVLLIVAVPVVAVASWGFFHTPKHQPQTREDWWDENWRRFL